MKLQTKNSQTVAALKQLVIAEVKHYCKLLNNGYSDFCYLDTINKILQIELDTD